MTEAIVSDGMYAEEYPEEKASEARQPSGISRELNRIENLLESVETGVAVLVERTHKVQRGTDEKPGNATGPKEAESAPLAQLLSEYADRLSAVDLRLSALASVIDL